MYQNFMFDLYGTIIDIHTNEIKPYLWKKMSCYMCLQGADYTAKELQKAYQQALAQQYDMAEVLTEEEIKEYQKRLFSSLKWIDDKVILQQKLSKSTTKNSHPITLSDIEPNLHDVIQNLCAAKGISVSSSQIADWALFMRSISLEYIRLFDGAKKMLKELNSINLYLNY